MTSVEPEGKRSEKVERNGMVWLGGDGGNAANGHFVTRATVQGLFTWLFLGCNGDTIVISSNLS